MATPFVAGAIALALEDEPSLTPEEIKARIQRAAAAEGVPPAEWHLDVAALLRLEPGLSPASLEAGGRG